MKRVIGFCGALLIASGVLAAGERQGVTPTGLPWSSSYPSMEASPTPLTNEAAFNNWLGESAQRFGYAEDAELAVRSLESGNDSYTIYKVQQTIDGIEIFGHQSVFVTADGQPDAAFVVSSDLPYEKHIAADQQMRVAQTFLQANNYEVKGDLSIQPVYWKTHEQLIAAIRINGNLSKQGKADSNELIVSIHGDELHRIETHKSFAYEIFDIDAVCDYYGESGPVDPDALYEAATTQFTGANASGNVSTSNERILVDLYEDAKRFMKDELGQPGIDYGNTVFVYSFVGDHLYDGLVNCAGNEPSNAFWASLSAQEGLMVIHGPLLGNPEVIMHEMGHGIIDFSSQLVYEGQSGALNEAVADAFGVSFAAWKKGRLNSPSASDWQIRLVRQVIRDFENPTSAGNNPDHYRERYRGSEDHGGVHINSSIINHAYYLLAEGGSHRRVGGQSVIKIGMKKALAIWMYGTTNLLTPTSNFTDARFGFAKAAEILYGKCSDERTAVHQAFDAVGVPGSWTVIDKSVCAPPPEPPKEDPPKVDPPKEDPPKEDPPKVEPPKEEPPKEKPQKQDPPKEKKAEDDSSMLIAVIALAAAGLLLVLVLLARAKPRREATGHRYASTSEERSKIHRDASGGYHKPAVAASSVGAIAATLQAGDQHMAISLTEKGLVIGRADDADVQLSHKSLSSYHARLSIKGGQLYLEDIGSSYGSFYQGAALNKGQPVVIAFDTPFKLSDLKCVVSQNAAAPNNAPQPVSSGFYIEGHDGKHYPLDGARLSQGLIVGRGDDCDLVIASNSVSTKHAKLFIQGQDIYVEDIGSSYGTELNGQKLAANQAVKVAPGSQLKFSDYQCSLKSSGSQAAAPAANVGQSGETLKIEGDAGRFTLSSASALSGLLLGKSEECDVVITSPSISRKHAKVYFEGGEWFIEDVGSAYGTFLCHDITGGQGQSEEMLPPHRKTRLKPGQKIKLADQVFKINLVKG